MITLDRLSQIIPPDQAVANKALAVSLQGITGISSLTLSQLAKAAGNVQTTEGLPLVAAQTSAVSSAAVTAILNSVGTGTGQNGTVELNDVLGTAIGYVSANVLTSAVSTFNTMSIAPLIGIYSEMANTVNGVYGDPVTGPVIIPSGPAAGTYTTANEAFTTGLIPAAQTEISSTIAANPNQTTELNSGWANIMNQLALEKSTQAKADLDFAALTPNSTSSVYSLVFSLPSYGQDTEVGGTASFMQNLADMNTLTGQTIIAVMRQGQTNLESTGITSTAQVPDNPNTPVPTAPLLPAQPPYPAS